MITKQTIFSCAELADSIRTFLTADTLLLDIETTVCPLRGILFTVLAVLICLRTRVTASRFSFFLLKNRNRKQNFWLH